MRIALFNWSNRVAGGVETYLRTIVPELRRRGDEVALVHQTELPPASETIAAFDRSWRADDNNTLTALNAWNPDLLFVHGWRADDWLAPALTLAPAIFFCHDYTGICISGTKTWRNPVAPRNPQPRACHRALGPGCLLHYYPHHCGGWNPATMWKEYDLQSRRLELLRSAATVIVASEFMRKEYLRNGLAAGQVRLIPLMPQNGDALPGASPYNPPPAPPWNLLFAGRMEWMKGGDPLLDALPHIARALGQPVHLTLCGDGRLRGAWEARARAIRSDAIRISFAGWRNAAAMPRFFTESHLLVMPSVWPEPFGLAGIEAGRHGLPAAAFRNGGIPEWLVDGVSGFTAPADPPTAQGLADAVVRCLANPAVYADLRRAAAASAARFTLAAHVDALQNILHAAVERRAA